MRSASERCAIETIERRGRPSAARNRARRRRGARPRVQTAKPGEASRLLRRIASAKRSAAGKKDLELEHADALDRRLLDLLDQARADRGRGPRARRARQRREQDVFATADRIRLESRADRGARRRRPARDSRSARRRRGRRSARRTSRSTESGVPARAARRVEDALGAAGEAARCDRAPDPTSASPFSRVSAWRAHVRRACAPSRAAADLVDPGTEVAGGQLREGQQQIAEVALRIDRDHRDRRR